MFISFSYQHWQYPFFMSIFFFFQLLPLEYVDIIPESMLFPLFNSFAMILAIIPEFVIRYRINPRLTSTQYDSIKTSNIFYFDLVSQEKCDQKKRAWYYLWITVGVLGFMTNMTHIKFANLHSDGYSTLQTLLGIIITWGLCYIFFKKKLFRHHFVALVLITVASLYFYLIDMEYFIEVMIKLNANYIAMFFIIELSHAIFSSLQNVNEYYIMIIKYYSGYYILFIEGLISLILCFVLIGIAECVPVLNYQNIFLFLNKAKWNVLVKDFNEVQDWPILHKLFLVSYIVCGFMMNLFRIQTNKLLTPSHQYMGEILYIFYYFIFDASNGDETKWLINRCLYSLLLVFALLIFNENIILRCCGLEKYTFNEIHKRGNEDLLLMKMNEITQMEISTYEAEQND